MMCLTRTTVALSLLCLLTPSLTRSGQAQDQGGTRVVKRTFLISGIVGQPGVVMLGLPGNPITGTQGEYGVQVEYGWSGTVTPTKKGLQFNPPVKSYTKITRDQVHEDYTATTITFTISGTTGVSGVRMLGLPDSPVTDEQGAYRSLVPYGWSGSVTPTRPGYLLKPPSKTYQAVTADQVQENYTAIMITFTISGSIGLPGVVMKGLPGDPLTSETGSYRAEVPYGWSGTITPSKAGFEFTPASREYPAVVAPHDRQDFQARVRTFTISGNGGIGGAAMTGLPGDPITDARGTYQAKVEYGWSGKVMPRKEGHRFEPAFRTYPKVTADIRNQDYTAQPLMVTISDRIRAGNEPIAEVKVTADPGGQSALTDLQGRYAIQVPSGWTGRLTFSKEGFDFRPDSKPFTNVTADIIGEEPTPSTKRPAPLSRTQAYPRAVLPVPAGNVFVIPTAQVVPQKLAETADDLRIMLQIFREKVSEPRLIRGAFVDFGDFFSDRDRAQEAFYLQGLAAVFVLEMEAPFSFAPPQATEGQAAQENVDVVWQRARQKLYSPQDPARGSSVLAGETERMDFQQFQEDLLKTFRHAANLRNLEPNEAVVLMIKARDESAGWPGAPAGAGGSFSSRPSVWFEGGSYSSSSGTFGPSGGTSQADSHTYSRGSASSRDRAPRSQPGSAPVAPSAVLTIQARKADIDAFAKGSLSFEQFQQRVKSFTY
jgi:hypothetical protein